MEVCCDAYDFCEPASFTLGMLDGRSLPVAGGNRHSCTPLRESLSVPRLYGASVASLGK